MRALHYLSFLRSITKSYYRNSVGALLVYDICNRDSYKHIPVWMMEAKRHIEPHKAVFILVGCKLDIAADEDQVKIGENREIDIFLVTVSMHGDGKHYSQTLHTHHYLLHKVQVPIKLCRKGIR